jgi:hypothetical protein
MIPVYQESIGTGVWKNERLRFTTDSIANSALLRLLPGVNNVGDIYVDYAFCVLSDVRNGGFEDWTAAAPESWVVGANTTAEIEESDISGGYKSMKFTTGGAVTSTSANWLRSDYSLDENMMFLVTMRVKYVSGSQSLQIGDGYSIIHTLAPLDYAAWTEFSFIHTSNASWDDLVFGGTAGGVWLIDEVATVEITSFSDSEKVLKYESSLVPVTGFTIDFFVRHSWDADDGATHQILDTTGSTSTQNRFYVTKASSDKLYFVLYGDTASGFKEVYLDVTETNFVKDVWHRITVTFDPDLDEVYLYLNGLSVGTLGSGGTWVDPTTWSSYLFVGGSRLEVPGDVDICQFSIWNEPKSPETVQTWYDTERNFIDITGYEQIAGIANPTANHTTSEVNDLPNEEDNQSETADNEPS